MTDRERLAAELGELPITVWEATHGGLVSVKLADFIPEWLRQKMVAAGVTLAPRAPEANDDAFHEAIAAHDDRLRADAAERRLRKCEDVLQALLFNVKCAATADDRAFYGETLTDAEDYFENDSAARAPSEAAPPDERTVYYRRCGWCGAYEGTVDPTEPCAKDRTGFIGPHQFGVYEVAARRG